MMQHNCVEGISTKKNLFIDMKIVENITKKKTCSELTNEAFLN